MAENHWSRALWAALLHIGAPRGQTGRPPSNCASGLPATIAGGPERLRTNTRPNAGDRGTDAAKRASENGSARGRAGDAPCCINSDQSRCREFKSAGKTGAGSARQECWSRSLHERRRARIGVGDRCAAQRLLQLESRRRQSPCFSIHRHRNLPESCGAARGCGDPGEPFRERMRCDHHSGLSIRAPLRRCRKGHPEVFRGDRKIGRTSAVPDQCQRTPGSDADRRQWMRGHRRRHSVCRGFIRGSSDGSTRANADGFTIPRADGKMKPIPCVAARRRQFPALNKLPKGCRAGNSACRTARTQTAALSTICSRRTNRVRVFTPRQS